MGKPFLVIDYNPETIDELTRQGIATEFGDAGDLNFLESLDLTHVELAISTIPNSETNLLIHRAVKAANSRAIVMVVAHRVKDALSHYDEGVDYVILPHFLGGRYAAEIVIEYHTDKSKYDSLRAEHIEHLHLRAGLGHEHPHRA